MSYGMQIYGAGGLWLDLTDRLVRFIDWFEVSSQSGSRRVPGLGSNGFFLVQGVGGYFDGGNGTVDQPAMTMQHIWRDGDTLRWDWRNYDHGWSPLRDQGHYPRFYVTVLLFR